MNRLQEIAKVKNPAVSKAKALQLLRALKKYFVLGEYDAVTLTMLYLKVLHDMVSKSS